MLDIKRYKTDIEAIFWRIATTTRDEVNKRVKLWKSSETIKIDFWDFTEFENLLERVYQDWVEQWRKLEKFNIK